MGRELWTDVSAARGTLAVVCLLLLVQLAIWLPGDWAWEQSVYRNLGLSREGMADWKLWSLLTHALLHGGWWHLLMNLAALLLFGARVEKIGSWRLLLRVLAAGVVMGGLFHLLMVPDAVLVGVSGGVIALLLCLGGLSPGSRMWPIPVSGRNLGLGVALASGLLGLLYPALGVPYLSDWGWYLDAWSGGMLFVAAHACHFGGALAGLVVAVWILRPRVNLRMLQEDRRRREEL